MEQIRKRDRLKAQSRQRWPKSKKKGIELIKQAKARFENSLADELLKLINEREVEKVKETLDKIWRKRIQTGKDIEAIQAAQKFLREANSS